MPRPLDDLTVLEFRGRAPVDFAGYMLADMGARVLSIEPPSALSPAGDSERDLLQAGRERISLDLKTHAGSRLAKRLASQSDVLIEGFRPGAMERLNLGPNDLRAENKRLIYARITGYGQYGPYSKRAGHDLNYLALSGTLGIFGRSPEEPPAPPINLLADIAGGSVLTINAILAALYRRERHGIGAVIDSSMVDGVSYMATHTHILTQQGSRGIPKRMWSSNRGNVLSGAAPYYDVYRTVDGAEVSVSCIEPRNLRHFLRSLEIDVEWAAAQYDTEQWPSLRSVIGDVIGRMTLDDIETLADIEDLDVAPTLSLENVQSSSHHVSRGTFRNVGSARLPAPAPRFDDDRIPPEELRLEQPGESTLEVLARLGLEKEEVATLIDQGAVAGLNGSEATR